MNYVSALYKKISLFDYSEMIFRGFFVEENVLHMN